MLSMQGRLGVIAPFVLLAGCSGGSIKRVDGAALGSATLAQQTEINRRAGAYEDGKAALEAAENERARAEIALEIHLRESEQAEVQAKNNEQLRRRAAALKLEDAARGYATRRASLELIVEEARQRVRRSQAELEYARQQVELREAELRLADSEWEVEKATAAKNLDNPLSRSVQLSEFKSQVADAARAVAREQDDTARAWRRVEEARKRHNQALERLPTTAEATREMDRLSGDNARLSGQIDLLERRIRELERQKAQLSTARASTATTADALAR